MQLLQGVILEAKGKTEEAKQLYEELIKKEPSNIVRPIHSPKLTCLARKQAPSSMLQGDAQRPRYGHRRLG